VYAYIVSCVSRILCGTKMRTNIVIDDKLMSDALKATGLSTKKEAVEMGLKTLIRLKKQERIRKFRGKLSWEGDLTEMRNTR
jgi:Arc/MetJ family transcription regulator